jgi:hypothetical protein
MRFSLRMMISGRVELLEPAQTVVAVDDAAVEIVEIRRREPAAVERHERAQVGGITGMIVSIIHSGLLPLSRNASTTLRRFAIFLRFASR